MTNKASFHCYRLIDITSRARRHTNLIILNWNTDRYSEAVMLRSRSINKYFVYFQKDINQRESFASKGDPDEFKITNGTNNLSSTGIQKKSVAPQRPKTLVPEKVVSFCCFEFHIFCGAYTARTSRRPLKNSNKFP